MNRRDLAIAAVVVLLTSPIAVGMGIWLAWELSA